MSAFELNKIAGAVLFAALVAMIAYIAAKNVFDSHTVGHDVFSAKDHYSVPGNMLNEIEEIDLSNKEEEAIEVSFLDLVSTSGIESGKKVFKKCAACHTIDSNGANKAGPNLWKIVGRQVASIDGFGYSEALKSLGGIWDVERLGAFLLNPKEYVPGTKMGFSGIKKDRKRADLVRFLITLDTESK